MIKYWKNNALKNKYFWFFFFFFGGGFTFFLSVSFWCVCVCVCIHCVPWNREKQKKKKNIVYGESFSVIFPWITNPSTSSMLHFFFSLRIFNNFHFFFLIWFFFFQKLSMKDVKITAELLLKIFCLKSLKHLNFIGFNLQLGIIIGFFLFLSLFWHFRWIKYQSKHNSWF